MNYTDDDVQRLVESATAALERPGSDFIGPSVRDRIRDALTPFQSDPDADLIEAMATAIHYGTVDDPGTWKHTPDDYQRLRRDEARVALAAYRKHMGE